LVKAFVDTHLDAPEHEIKTKFRTLLIEQTQAFLEQPAYRVNTGKRIAVTLQHLAHEADIVLDLHTGPISAKHLYCPEYAKASASYFDIEHVLLIPNEFDGAMDEATFCPWWQLSEAFKAQGRNIPVWVEAYTVELGSQEKIDLTEAKLDAESIMSYLNHKQAFIDADYAPKPMTRYGCLLDDYLAFYAPMGGMVEYKATLGSHIKAGDTIAQILRMEQYLSEKPLHDITLDKDAITILHFASASVNQGTELYKFFTNYFEL